MIVYIKENENANAVCRILSIFKLEKKENKTIINIPIQTHKKNHKIKYTAEKLSKYLYNNNIKDVALSTKIMKIEEFRNILLSNNINILDGKILSKYLTYNIIQKIFNYKNKRIEAGEITILTNENDELNMENITKIAKNTKRLNIITNHTKKFRKLVDYLYNDLGILVKLTNNQNINLKNSNIIVNFDFPEEVVNRLDIASDAIIVSIPHCINIYSKRFSGINIKNWNIEIPKKYRITGFDDNIIYESEIYNKPKNIAFEQIRNDNIKIKNFLGINGVINRKEFI